MKISIHFNKFIFGVVLEDLKQSKATLRIDELGAVIPTKPLTKEALRNLLKYLDLDYPRDKRGEPLSYTQLDSKQMTAHIEWIERTVGMSGYELKYISQEWQKLIEKAR